MQTWYDIDSRKRASRLLEAVYKRIAWGTGHAEFSAYIQHLTAAYPDALLAQHPLPAAEVQFWQNVIDEAIQLLGPLQLPATDERIRQRPACYLPFLLRVVQDINLTLIAAELEDNEEQQASFVLVPQAHSKSHFIEVGTYCTCSTCLLIINAFAILAL